MRHLIGPTLDSHNQVFNIDSLVVNLVRSSTRIIIFFILCFLI